ncbi:SDR family oxidoreductase [Metabacillus litoralis]|uniref:SDR family oxidoreductase n=1 Tax=Metabacillus litoralis TaxID=152268 RepID=UPI00203A5332|nr:SDR family oxidoreductase [Metabacillus litoralis]MCM3413626.1 SDR family oxidoreductase [Metabacillus litoralis]
MKLFITGANRGLGLALTTEAVKRGHTVFAGIRSPQKQSDALNHLSSLFPNKVQLLQVDVADELTCQTASEKLKADNTTLDAIINNAGILDERSKTIEDIDLDKVEQTFNINLYGPMRVIKYFLPLLHKGPDSTIINISSEAGSFQNAYGGDYPYALSKSALNMFSEQLRKYLKNDGVSVYAVHPGWIRTDMGGEKAPGTPEESAHGIMDIMEKKIEVNCNSSFINTKGEAMPQ